MRRVEVYVGIYQGDARTWFTGFVDIPPDTPDEQIESAAEAPLPAQSSAGLRLRSQGRQPPRVAL